MLAEAGRLTKGLLAKGDQLFVLALVDVLDDSVESVVHEFFVVLVGTLVGSFGRTWLHCFDHCVSDVLALRPLIF